MSGAQDLHGWWQLSYAAFLVLPRALMQEMPDDWQRDMARLLREYDATWTNQPPIETTVRAVENGKLVRMPDVFTNYRHPVPAALQALRLPACGGVVEAPAEPLPEGPHRHR